MTDLGPTGPLLNTTQAARIIGCSRRTVQRLILDGHLVATMKLPGPSGDYLIPPENVTAYADRRNTP